VIRRLYVHNFRCLENFELPVSRHSSVLLIGENGSGKTTVGLVLEILQKIARGTNRTVDLIEPKDLSMGRTEVPVRFEIEVELGVETYQYVVALDFPPIIQEQLTDDPTFVFKQWVARMLVLRPALSLISGDSREEMLQPNIRVILVLAANDAYGPVLCFWDEPDNFLALSVNNPIRGPYFYRSRRHRPTVEGSPALRSNVCPLMRYTGGPRRAVRGMKVRRLDAARKSTSPKSHLQ
jgi:hypothetical protein